MQSNAANQTGEIVQLVRFAPSTTRSHSPWQSPWQGSLPHGVKTIMTRVALEAHLRESYAKWASNFARLTDEFLAHIFETELNRVKKLARDQWTGFPFVDWHYCKIGINYLWVRNRMADGPSSFATRRPILMHVFLQLRICRCCALTLFGPLGLRWPAIPSRLQIWSGILIGNDGLVKNVERQANR
jgi:hypothetical protein